MLTGKELGEAIRAALVANGKTPADAARRFKVRPPSVSGWMTTGRIGKGRFDELVAWLDKTPRSYWGLMDVAPVAPLLLTHDASTFRTPLEAAAIRPSQTLEAHLRGLSEYLVQLDGGERELAGLLLLQLAKRPEDHQRVARMIQASVDAANNVMEIGRRQESTSSIEKR